MSRYWITSTALASAIILAPSDASAAEIDCVCVAPLPLPPSSSALPWKVAAPWAGPYVGVSFALVDNNVHQSENGPGHWPAAYGPRYHDSYSATSGRVGFHAGYNVQRGAGVFGIEADIGKQLGSESHVGLVSGNDTFRPAWDASVRARAGIATGDVLLYGTGGVSFSRVELKLDDVSAGSNTHVGWTAGAGAEVMLSPHVVGRIESRYTDYGDKTYQTVHGPIDMGFDDKRVSVGLSYKF